MVKDRSRYSPTNRALLERLDERSEHQGQDIQEMKDHLREINTSVKGNQVDIALLKAAQKHNRSKRPIFVGGAGIASAVVIGLTALGKAMGWW